MEESDLILQLDIDSEEVLAKDYNVNPLYTDGHYSGHLANLTF